MKTFVEKYLEDHFDLNNFEIFDDKKLFQGKKIIDDEGNYLIVEGIPFKNSVIVHLDDEQNKFIYDDKNKLWVEENEKLFIIEDDYEL